MSRRYALEIAALYDEAEEKSPTPRNSIVPLAMLARGLNRNCSELPQLCARAAFDLLLARGGMMRRPSPAACAMDEAALIEPLAGFLWANAFGGAIFVRSEDPVSRRRFSVAHELGHFVLHLPLEIAAARRAGLEAEIEITDVLLPEDLPQDEAAGPGEIKTPEASNNTLFAQREREANAFAAELLMPEDLLREIARELGPRRDADLVWRLSCDLLVSRAAMHLRLRTLGLLREGATRQVLAPS